MKITIKSWEEISNTPGVLEVSDGLKMNQMFFNKNTMKFFCGKTIEVIPLRDDFQGYSYHGHSFYWGEWMLQDKVTNFKTLYGKLSS